MKDAVIKTIKKYNMIEANDKIIVGVSGGPDSMSLLHVLYTLKDFFCIKQLYVAHINHCIRGKEADEDEEYVRKFCLNKNIPFFSLRENVNKIAKEQGISSESAGRNVRYSFFEKLLNELDAQKIALAHNLNDQAETVIMRIMRGSGLKGISGIKPVRDNIFIRPIIHISRNNIEQYCTDNNLNPRIDKTNLETIYTRNKIRLELIPYIKNNFNEDIINTLNRLAESSLRDNEFMEKYSKNKFKIYCSIKGKKVIISKEAFKEDECILTRMLRKALKEVCKNLYNFESKHIYKIINMQVKNTGKTINLPNDIIVENVYGNIHIYSKLDLKEDKNTNINLTLGENNLKDIETKVNIQIINEYDNEKSDIYTQYFDLDKINKNNIYLRHRKPGDKFKTLGMLGSKKLKDLFIDLKIPRQERDKIKLICFGEEIGWIVGYRISEDFKVDCTTKNILKINIKGGNI